ncbi:DUF5958 family protein [Streptomyces sp. NPDC048659]|uniref:DUF5958 family protein n=1 Tax=Streptomyces sp. NPDC048659 TaxID=3155489 RepID=UPI00343348AB
MLMSGSLGSGSDTGRSAAVEAGGGCSVLNVAFVELWKYRAMIEKRHADGDGRDIRRETERVVNEVAQGLRTLDSGVGWFSGFDVAWQAEILCEVGGYAMQAHITAEDGRAGVARSGVKITANPSVMICMDPPRYAFSNLPAAEYVTAFRVLVSTFAVADTLRREKYCKGACSHVWHNLSAGTERGCL